MSPNHILESWIFLNSIITREIYTSVVISPGEERAREHAPPGVMDSAGSHPAQRVQHRGNLLFCKDCLQFNFHV